MAGHENLNAREARADGGIAEVLIVDGAGTSLEHLARPFDDDGFRVRRCELTALRHPAVLRAQVDLVISACDSVTPHHDVGWVCRQVEAPVAVVLPDRSRVDPVGLFECGADAVWRMPLSSHVAVAAARALLRRRPSRMKAEPARFGTISVDAEAGATVAGRAIALDPVGVRLLEQLVRDAGRRVSSRSQLAAAAGLSDAELGAQIRRLRTRLEEVEGRRRIITVRGVGFRLVEAPTLFTRTVAGAADELVATAN